MNDTAQQKPPDAHDAKLRLDAENVLTWDGPGYGADPLTYLHLQRFAKEIIRLLDSHEHAWLSGYADGEQVGKELTAGRLARLEATLTPKVLADAIATLETCDIAESVLENDMSFWMERCDHAILALRRAHLEAKP